MNYYKRYIHGEYEKVWRELGMLNMESLNNVIVEATAVAQETMVRVKFNIRILIARLKAIGYRFGYILPSFELAPIIVERYSSQPEWLEQLREAQQSEHQSFLAWIATQPAVFTASSGDVDAKLRDLTKLLNRPLPLALSAWYRQIGEVNFMGTVSLPLGKIDPLAIFSLDQILDDARSDIDYGEPFKIFISLDNEQKYHSTGGEMYSYHFANTFMDGEFRWVGSDCHSFTFVEYLRFMVQHACLPNEEDIATLCGYHYRDPTSIRHQIKAFLIHDLVLF